jgi:hypothetical protein
VTHRSFTAEQSAITCDSGMAALAEIGILRSAIKLAINVSTSKVRDICGLVMRASTEGGFS